MKDWNTANPIFVNTGVAPCKECQERFLGCHSECGAYKSFATKRASRKEMLNEKTIEERILNGFSIDSLDKVVRSNGYMKQKR